MSRYLGLMTIALLLAAAVPKAQAQGPGDPQAQQNVRQSEQYQHLVCANAAFRARRIAQECGPLQGSEMYQGCVASFNCGNQAPVNPNAIPPSEKIQ
ncbi:MAG TPA: hypothetical protein VND87_16210 [Stellaceae bacterium]|nr:hypothetical protein [Stellaceae bacterium]